ncbi:PaaI family thioesterase [Pseudonocardia xishanensis]|uniref:PaaI family thioesterase n=1 Tax=Pseudonocardia xishanensis TaxID=630995 RepID=A0ABP8RTL3_9PSEU
MTSDVPQALPEHVDGVQDFLGFTFVESTPDRVEVVWDVPDRVRQKQGIVHGGAYCALVEAAASRGAARWWGDRGKVVGVSNSTDFLRPVRTGRLSVVATPVARGRTQQLWEVAITDSESRLVATGRVRLQNLRAD